MRRANAARCLALSAVPGVNIIEEVAGGLACGLDLLDRLVAEAQTAEQASARAIVIKSIKQELNRPAGDLQAEVIRGHIFERMRLVKNRHLIIRQDARARAADGQIAEE